LPPLHLVSLRFAFITSAFLPHVFRRDSFFAHRYGVRLLRLANISWPTLYRNWRRFQNRATLFVTRCAASLRCHNSCRDSYDDMTFTCDVHAGMPAGWRRFCTYVHIRNVVLIPRLWWNRFNKTRVRRIAWVYDQCQLASCRRSLRISGRTAVLCGGSPARRGSRDWLRI
jgi:hypothetical protein